MRALGYMLLWIFLALMLALLGWKLWSYLSVHEPFSGDARLSDVLRSTSYELPAEKWLEFPIPNNNGLRVLTTALVGTDESLMDSQRWGYTLAYQLVGRGGNIIKEWNYHYRTGITRYIDAVTGRYQPRSYVADIQAVPADSRAMRVADVDLTEATALRIRLLDVHPGLQDVLVRCYVRERVAEHKLGFIWQRLNAAKRERIGSVSVFGAEFLREQEQTNLLRWEWSPIGPAGVHEQDYQSRVLFVLNDSIGESIDDDVLPEGIYADRLTRGMLDVPEGSWNLRLELVAIDPSAPAGDNSPVHIRWYGKDGKDRWETALDYRQRSPYLRDSVTTGVLEVVSEKPVIVRAYLSGGDQVFMLRAEQRRLRTYLLQAGQPIDYRVEHVKDSPTPLRIDLRYLWREGESLGRIANYQLLNESGDLLGSGEISVDQPLSLFDRVVNPVSGERVSDEQRRYFYVPREVATLRVSASQPVLIAAYSRPDDLSRRVRVPEDYRNPGWDPARQPAWFMVRPVGHDLLRLQQRSLLLVLQSRPPELDPQIAAGRYEWKEYQPNGRWRARELLVPRENERPVQDRSRGGVFTPVASNKQTSLFLHGQTGRQQVTPTLIYVGDNQEPFDVSVDVDGETVVTTRVFSPRSRLRLPVLATGRHTMYIRSRAGGSWWMNYTGSGEGGALLRKVIRLKDIPVHFDYAKQGREREVVSGVLYCEEPGRVQLEASVDALRTPGLEPRNDWSFLKRSFDISVEFEQTIPVMDTPDVSLSPGQAFFLALGEDLAAGAYRISLDQKSGRPCYLNMHRVIAGQPVLRRFFREYGQAAGGEGQ